MSASESSPTTSRRSSSEIKDDKLEIFVKNVAGDTTSLEIPSTASIATVKSLLTKPLPSSTENADCSPSRDFSTSSTDPAVQRPLLTKTSSSDSSELRLVFAGKQLSPSSTLRDCEIPSASTLHLASPFNGGGVGTSAGSTEETQQQSSDDAKAAPVTDGSGASTTSGAGATPPPKKNNPRKPRCNYKACTAPVQRIVGDCGFCGGKFCGKHRLLESHGCSGLEDCKDEARERNKERLEGERTVVVRGV